MIYSLLCIAPLWSPITSLRKYIVQFFLRNLRISIYSLCRHTYSTMLFIWRAYSLVHAMLHLFFPFIIHFLIVRRSLLAFAVFSLVFIFGSATTSEFLLAQYTCLVIGLQNCGLYNKNSN